MLQGGWLACGEPFPRLPLAGREPFELTMKLEAFSADGGWSL